MQALGTLAARALETIFTADRGERDLHFPGNAPIFRARHPSQKYTVRFLRSKRVNRSWTVCMTHPPAKKREARGDTHPPPGLRARAPPPARSRRESGSLSRVLRCARCTHRLPRSGTRLLRWRHFHLPSAADNPPSNRLPWPPSASPEAAPAAGVVRRLTVPQRLASLHYRRHLQGRRRPALSP